jgi:hypothetical protein
MSAQREGRLREQFRDWYPIIEPGRWYHADALVELVLHHRRSGTPRWEMEPRIPCDQCFEFRGGTVRGDSEARTRRSDSTPAGE